MKVAIKANIKDNPSDILSALSDLLRVFNLEIKPNSKIAIKPNLCALKPPESGATTDVKVVSALIALLKELEPTTTIYVVESDSTSKRAWEAFEALGYRKLESMHGVKLVNLSEDPLEHLKVEEAHILNEIKVPRTLLNCDMIISVAKLKTHAMERITCTLKNLFGLLPEKRKSKYHPYISKVIHDIYKVFENKLLLAIVDGIYCMEGKGPVDGYPRKAGLLIMGDNPIAVDIVATKIMGLNCKEVPHLSYLMRQKGISMEDIMVQGDNVNLNLTFTPKLDFILERFTSCLLPRLEQKAQFKMPYRLTRSIIRKIRRLISY